MTVIEWFGCFGRLQVHQYAGQASRVEEEDTPMMQYWCCSAETRKQQCQPCRKRPQRRRRPHLRTCNLLLVEFLVNSGSGWRSSWNTSGSDSSFIIVQLFLRVVILMLEQKDTPQFFSRACWPMQYKYSIHPFHSMSDLAFSEDPVLTVWIRAHRAHWSVSFLLAGWSLALVSNVNVMPEPAAADDTSRTCRSLQWWNVVALKSLVTYPLTQANTARSFVLFRMRPVGMPLTLAALLKDCCSGISSLRGKWCCWCPSE